MLTLNNLKPTPGSKHRKKGACDAVKLLAHGELSKALNISVDLASAAAEQKVSAAGGTLTVLSKSSES